MFDSSALMGAVFISVRFTLWARLHLAVTSVNVQASVFQLALVAIAVHFSSSNSLIFIVARLYFEQSISPPVGKSG